MQFISEDHIEKIIDGYYESEKKFFSDREALISGQPAFSAMLTDEGFELLSDDEYELLWFMATVIHTTCADVHGQIRECEIEVMSELEENNWLKMEEAKGGSFHERLNVFFHEYSQEDLLAFVEDSLESDEDIEVSPAGRELIFVACKTLIDALESGSQS